MTKRELIRDIHDKTNYNFADIEKIMDVLFDSIVDGLVEEDKVVISGFGTFEKHYQEGYEGLHPQTGEAIKVKGNYKIRFTASKLVKGALNGEE